jgi:hypothetical protein
MNETELDTEDLSDDTELLMALVEVSQRIEHKVHSIERYVAWAFWLVVTPILIGLVLSLIGLTLTAFHVGAPR